MTSNTVLTGQVLEKRYQLNHILGQGSFGAAYLAQDLKLKRACVVKQMLIPGNKSTSQIDNYHGNFEREASLLVQLNHPGHPNIPEIYDYFSDREGNYLVMKYIEGRSLKKLQQEKGGRVDWQDAVRYTIEVVSALEYMHAGKILNNNDDANPNSDANHETASPSREPIIHRDIKPDNILLGNDGRVWLVDFGLAKAKPVEGSGDLTLTQASGSLGYSPLEQWMGEPVPASDIYALGATLHHLVTGQNPGEAFKDGFDLIKLEEYHGQFESIQNLDADLPKALAEIIVKATNADLKQRPTAPQLRQQLEALISGPQHAALFTFKNGESAYDVKELVALCEKYPYEAQNYLLNGDFESWFRIINRNDLAEAAQHAQKQKKLPRRQLRAFLRSIMPNLWLRHLRQWIWRFFKLGTGLGTIGLLILVAVICTAVITFNAGIGFFSNFLVTSYNWDFSQVDPNGPNQLNETTLTQVMNDFLRAYPVDASVDLKAPNIMNLYLEAPGSVITHPFTITLENNRPLIIPASEEGAWFFKGITEGINHGLDAVFENGPYDVEDLTVTEEAIFYSASPSGRAPLPEGLEASSRYLPLLAVFNDRDQPIELEIGELRWEIAAQDSKAIEIPRGTYHYRIYDPKTDQLLEAGEQTWHAGSYRWHIE